MWMVSTSTKTDKVLFESWKTKSYKYKSETINDIKDITDLKDINACICKF